MMTSLEDKTWSVYDGFLNKGIDNKAEMLSVAIDKDAINIRKQIILVFLSMFEYK